GRIAAAKDVLATIVGARVGGLLTRGIGETGSVSPQQTADVSLWLFEATERLLEKTGLDDDFVRETLYPVLSAIFERVTSETREVIWCTPDGLLANGSEDAATPLTWMDSRADGVAVTPRAEVAVELQALWSRACSTLARLAAHYADRPLAE